MINKCLNLPKGFRRSFKFVQSVTVMLNGTLSDFPCNVVFARQSELRANKCRAACSDKRSVTDLCGPMPLSG